MTKRVKQKVLIIKTGYSEFLEEQRDTKKVSYGDVLRTTPLLHAFKEDNVTWVTDEKAFSLLPKEPYINRLLRFDFISIAQLKKERFDTIINLEKIAGICAIIEDISTVRNFGFRFDPEKRVAKAYDRSYNALLVSTDLELKKQNQKTTQEILFEVVGKKWNREEYVLGYLPKTKEKYNVGLNTEIGEKWPTKAWPKQNWDDLENMLKENNITVTRQDKQNEGILTILNSYMDWINSCRMIISNDSLGMHLGIALKKKVLGLFGSTPSKEVYFYGRGKAILPQPIPNCLPCFKSYCEKKRNCMIDIKPKEVYKEIKSMQ